MCFFLVVLGAVVGFFFPVMMVWWILMVSITMSGLFVLLLSNLDLVNFVLYFYFQEVSGMIFFMDLNMKVSLIMVLVKSGLGVFFFWLVWFTWFMKGYFTYWFLIYSKVIYFPVLMFLYTGYLMIFFGLIMIYFFLFFLMFDNLLYFYSSLEGGNYLILFFIFDESNLDFIFIFGYYFIFYYFLLNGESKNNKNIDIFLYFMNLPLIFSFFLKMHLFLFLVNSMSIFIFFFMFFWLAMFFFLNFWFLFFLDYFMMKETFLLFIFLFLSGLFLN